MMSELSPNGFNLSDEQVNAEFAAMLGMLEGELATPMNEDELHAGLGDLAVSLSDVTIGPDEPHNSRELSATEEAEVADFADELDISALSMTPDELLDYYSHVDKVLNPRLETLGYRAIEDDAEERARELTNAQRNAQAIMASRQRHFEQQVHFETEAEARKTEKKKEKKSRDTHRPGVRHDDTRRPGDRSSKRTAKPTLLPR